MRRPSWILFPLYLSLSSQISFSPPLSRLHSQIFLPSFFRYLSPHSPSFNLSHSSHAVSCLLSSFFSLLSPPFSFMSPDFLLTVCILQSSLSICLKPFSLSFLFSLFPPFFLCPLPPSTIPCTYFSSFYFSSFSWCLHLLLPGSPLFSPLPLLTLSSLFFIHF